MPRYSTERKASVLKMLPSPERRPIREVAGEAGLTSLIELELTGRNDRLHPHQTIAVSRATLGFLLGKDSIAGAELVVGNVGSDTGFLKVIATVSGTSRGLGLKYNVGK